MRLPAVVRHTAYTLRGGFLVRPLIIAMSLGFAGFTISSLEERFSAIDAIFPAWPFTSRSDYQVAQVILTSIATSVMTVVSIVFAILLMSLTLASMQFSPRILVTFARDRVTQWTLGVYLGTFSYCISALPAAHKSPRELEPVATVSGAMLLGMLCVIWLLFFIHHISSAISVNHIVDNIARETELTMQFLMPKPRTFAKRAPPAPTLPGGEEAPVTSIVSGYIQYADFSRLTVLARAYGLTFRMTRRVGHFVPAGAVLLTATKGDRLSPELLAELREAFEIGPTRTLQQDIEFGIIQIVDIALRAISPAVNDPSTTITCVDQLSRILANYVQREPMETQFFDPPGKVRLIIPEASFERLVDYAFEQIRVYAKGDFAVALRLIRALDDIGHAAEDPDDRRYLADWGDRVAHGAAQRLAPEEMEELNHRNRALQASLRRVA